MCFSPWIVFTRVNCMSRPMRLVQIHESGKPAPGNVGPFPGSLAQKTSATEPPLGIRRQSWLSPPGMEAIGKQTGRKELRAGFCCGISHAGNVPLSFQGISMDFWYFDSRFVLNLENVSARWGSSFSISSFGTRLMLLTGHCSIMCISRFAFL